MNEKNDDGEEEDDVIIDPCESDPDPHCVYFHKSWTGDTLETAHAPVHSHEYLAGLNKKTRSEKEESETFLRGSPSRTIGSNWVKPCENFPYCTNTPAPLPMVPAPWHIQAPAVGHVFPSLSEPKYPLPWALARKLKWLSRQPESVKKKVREEKRKKDKEKEKLMKEAYKDGAFPGPNPERLDLRQHPLSPADMNVWQRAFLRRDEYDGKATFA